GCLTTTGRTRKGGKPLPGRTRKPPACRAGVAVRREPVLRGAALAGYGACDVLPRAGRSATRLASQRADHRCDSLQRTRVGGAATRAGKIPRRRTATRGVYARIPCSD